MRVPGVCRDPASAYDMHGIEGLGAMLGVETDRIDHGEGLFDGLENRSVIVHIRANRFESGSLVREHSPASFRMTRCDPHRVSAVEQTANNAMAEKARAAENQNPAKLSRHARLRRLLLRPRALRPRFSTNRIQSAISYREKNSFTRYRAFSNLAMSYLRKNERNGPFLERTNDELDPRPGTYREM